MTIPTLPLDRLYTVGSLRNTDEGVRFSLKNRLLGTTVTQLHSVVFDGSPVPLEAIALDVGGGRQVPATSIASSTPLDFPLRQALDIVSAIEPLSVGSHTIEVEFETDSFGTLTFEVEGVIAGDVAPAPRLPRDTLDDYAPEPVRARQAFVERFSDVTLEHVARYSFDPRVTNGNCEHFTGVAQVPIGFAGPLTVRGEHARGDFVIPLATTEGTLVASYNRGMKVLNRCGGAICSVVGDAMQRAPVFVLGDAREARAFVHWVQANIEAIREQAEATSRVARLQYIDPFLAGKLAYLRFNFSTGDAAGQNMVGRATFAACRWIREQYAGIEKFYLESNFATDKKSSQINIMRTRGKRVTAEAVVTRDVLKQLLRVEPECLAHHYNVANVGALLSGANNNGLHSANAVTAMFIATGQDVANVAESSAGLLYTEITDRGDLYLSITIPSLIVATHGGGTGLPTQRECLAVLGCDGPGKVTKLAEIVAATVLAGELSLAAAISSSDWVSSHERYGRNR